MIKWKKKNRVTNVYTYFCGIQWVVSLSAPVLMNGKFDWDLQGSYRSADLYWEGQILVKHLCVTWWHQPVTEGNRSFISTLKADKICSFQLWRHGQCVSQCLAHNVNQKSFWKNNLQKKLKNKYIYAHYCSLSVLCLCNISTLKYQCIVFKIKLWGQCFLCFVLPV